MPSVRRSAAITSASPTVGTTVRTTLTTATACTVSPKPASTAGWCGWPHPEIQAARIPVRRRGSEDSRMTAMTSTMLGMALLAASLLALRWGSPRLPRR